VSKGTGKTEERGRVVFVLETKSFVFVLRKRSLSGLLFFESVARLYTHIVGKEKKQTFFSPSDPPPSLTRTWGAAVVQGGVDEVQSSVVSDKYAPSRCVGGLGGNAIDERDPSDGHAGNAVGNHKVP
jgi:hypothetical protein